MTLSQEVVNELVHEFLQGVEEDDRQGLDMVADVEVVNRELMSISDPDPIDVANAIWDAIDGADEVMSDEYLDELADVVEGHWDELQVLG